MEHSWRYRSTQGTVCPTCSISHFPYCSESFGFDRSSFARDLHRLPVENNLQTFHRPFQDHRDPMFHSFSDNRAPSLLPSSSHFENRAGSIIPGISHFMNRAAQVMPDSSFMGNRPGSIPPGPFLDEQIPLNANPYDGNSISINEGLQSWSRSNSIRNKFLERETHFPSGAAFQQSDINGSELTHFDVVASINATKFRTGMVREDFSGMERVQKRIKVENSGSFTEQAVRSDFMANESLTSGARMLEEEWRLNISGARMLGDEWRLNLIREHGGQSSPGLDVSKVQRLQYGNRVGESNFTQSNQSTGESNLNSEYSYKASNSFQQSLVEQRYSHESLRGERRINYNEARASSDAQRSRGSAWPSSSDTFHNSRFNFTALNGLAMQPEQAGGAVTTFLSQNQPDQRNLYSQHQFPNAPNPQNGDRSIPREKTELDRGASSRMGGEHDLGFEQGWGQINSQVLFEQLHRDKNRPDLDSSFRNKEERIFHSQNDQSKDAHHTWVPSNPSQFYGHGQSESSLEVSGTITAGVHPSSDACRSYMSRNVLSQSAWSPAFLHSSLESDVSFRRNDLFLSESSSTRHRNFTNPVWQNDQEEQGEQHKRNQGEQTLFSLQQASLKEKQISQGPHEEEQQLHLHEHSSHIPLKHPQHHLQHPEPMHIQNWQALSVQNVHEHGHHVQQHEHKKIHLPMEDKWHNFQRPQPYARQHPIENTHGFHDRQNGPYMKFIEFKASQNLESQRHLNKDLLLPSSLQLGDVENLDRHREMLQLAPLSVPRPIEAQNMPMVDHSEAQNLEKQSYRAMPIGNSMTSAMQGQVASSVRPPFPSQQQLLPMEPPPLPPPLLPSSHLQALPSPPHDPSSPKIRVPSVPISSSASFSSSHLPTIHAFPEVQPRPQSYFDNKPVVHSSVGFSKEGSQFIQQTPSKQCVEEGQHRPLQPKQGPLDKPKVVDAIHLFKQPHRSTRPDHIVIILRGLPGGGKSYLARTLRDIEVANGGNAPRIHSMDDYFMAEVEKVEEHDGSNSTSSVKSKKRITKKVMEYCYEPEMEEAYRASMLKAFKKTLEEGKFTFIIVDDRNLRVADFAQFWAVGKRSGYEVYLLEATYKDPTGCAARNVHGFTFEDIQKMADKWEQAPSLYLQLDIQSLFHGDHLNQQAIQEVEMDMEDVACDEEGQETKMLTTKEQPSMDYTPDGSYEVGQRWETEQFDSMQDVKELGKSKWSEDVDDDDDLAKVSEEQHFNALSGLIQAYSKGEKSVHWGDQAGKGGFSIGAPKKQNIFSLIIGPGAGYNLDSNPLPEEENVDTSDKSNNGEFRRRTEFLEHLRAECESFRAVFDRRRQRIGGFDIDEE